MRGLRLKIVCYLMVVISLCVVIFAACDGNSSDNIPSMQMYTIQYNDNTGVHSIEVQSGKLYSISSIPEKNGYEFKGLYDAEVGGTQYVNAGGSSVAAFTDNKNIVLYPQFRAKEFTLILDYQGAAVTGSRSMKVSYNSEISELPLNLTLENKNFVGWFTQPNKQGIQVSDQYGIIPLKNVVNESIFDLSDPQGGIYLYAGFKNEEFTVTFYFTESGASEEVKVEYGTSIFEIQPETRVDGKAVIAWSKKRNDTNKEQIFNGKVTSDMVLYAAEYAPVIDFDSNGGNNINSVIARAGDTINLPIPTKENYKFVAWQTTSGLSFNATTMPTTSVKLTAKWQAMIIFDTNGGTKVENISKPQGVEITLPVTEKEGYIFAGWYDKNNEKYTDTVMPAESMLLYAKYYKCQLDSVTVLTSMKYNYATSPSFTVGSTYHYYNEIDVEYLLEKGVTNVVMKIQYSSWKEKTTYHSSYPLCQSMSWYTSKDLGKCFWSYDDEHYGNVSDSYTRTIDISLTTSKLYVCYYSLDKHGKNGWGNFIITFEYVDVSTLY